MTDTSSKTMKIIIVVAIAALVLRIAAGLVVGWDRLLPAADQALYHVFAKNILEGKGFQVPNIVRVTPKGVVLEQDYEKTGYLGIVIPNRPTAFFPPVYPVMMTAAYALFGPHYGSARLMQSILDALACFLIGWMGVKLFGNRQGILASLIYALYPAFIGLTTVLWTIGMGVFTMILALALTVNFQQKLNGWTALWMGMGWGLAELTRSVILPFLLVVIFLVWWDTRQALHATATVSDKSTNSHIRPGSSWKYPLIVAVGIIIVLLPWGIRNALVMGHFTVTPTKGGRNLYEMNNGIFAKSYMDFAAKADANTRIYHRYAVSRLPKLKRADLIEYPQFPVEMDEFERDRILKRQVKDFLLANPKVAIELCFLRFYSLMSIVPGFLPHWIGRIAGILSMGFVLFGGLIGLIINGKNWKNYCYFYLLIPYYVAIHTVTAAGIPHRLPLDAVLIPFASAAVFWVYERLFSHALPVSSLKSE